MRYLQNDTVDSITTECRTPAQCQGTVGIIMNVIVGVKMVILLILNTQGYLWWRKARASNFTAALKLLMIGSSAIVSEFYVADYIRVCLPIFKQRFDTLVRATHNCRLVCVLHAERACWCQKRHQVRSPQCVAIIRFCANSYLVLCNHPYWRHS